MLLLTAQLLVLRSDNARNGGPRLFHTTSLLLPLVPPPLLLLPQVPPPLLLLLLSHRTQPTLPSLHTSAPSPSPAG